jgi:hypothetical protein
MKFEPPVSDDDSCLGLYDFELSSSFILNLDACSDMDIGSNAFKCGSKRLKTSCKTYQQKTISILLNTLLDTIDNVHDHQTHDLISSPFKQIKPEYIFKRDRKSCWSVKSMSPSLHHMTYWLCT